MSFQGLTMALTLVTSAETHAAPLVADTDSGEVRSEVLGIEVTVEVMSIYNDRGTNIFSTTNQLEQGLNVGSFFGYSFGDSGLFAEAGVVMQVAGIDPGGLTRNGVNAEHNLLVGVERSLLGERLTAGAQVLVIMYPFADGALVRDFIPTVLEPSFFMEASDLVDVGLELTYSVGVQPEISAGHFLYVRSYLARSFAVGRGAALGGSFGAGYKFFGRPSMNSDRRFDVETSVDLALEVGRWSVTPALNAAWTDVAGADFGAGVMVWGSVAISTGL